MCYPAFGGVTHCLSYLLLLICARGRVLQTLLMDGKYQILELLRDSGDYRCCLCIDVETNNHFKPMVLNTYQKPSVIRSYLPEFYSMQNGSSMQGGMCSDFVELLTGPHSLTAVFEYHEGENLSDYFSRLNGENFETRLKLASSLLEEIIILDAFSDFVAQAVLSPENIVVQEKAQRIRFNYIISPLRYAGAGYKGRQTAFILRTIFVNNRFVPEALFNYIGKLEAGGPEVSSLVKIYAAWKRIENDLLSEHNKLNKESFFAYLIRKAKAWLRHKTRGNLPH